MNYSDALDFMMSEKKYIYDYHTKNDFSDFQFISSWDRNYKSWKNQNVIPTLLIRYEDLLTETFSVFRNVVEFINHTIRDENEIDKKKLKNSIISTEFNKLKDHEKKNGFSGEVLSNTLFVRGSYTLLTVEFACIIFSLEITLFPNTSRI